MIKKNVVNLYKVKKRKIDAFLLKPESKELLVFLSFLFVSACFWLLQTLNEEYEISISAPIEIVDTPEDIVITDQNTKEISLTIKDKGTSLIKYKYLKTIPKIKVPFNSLNIEKGITKITSSEYDKGITNILKATTKIINLYPDTIVFYHSNRGSAKRIPIRYKGSVSAQQQYYVLPPKYSSDSVTIYAPKHILDNIYEINTEEINLKELSETKTINVKLQKINGASLSPNDIDITFPIDIYTEKIIEIPIKAVNFPDNKRLRTFPSKVKVKIMIGASNFKEITERDFLITADYDYLSKLKENKFTPEIQNIENISIIDSTPNTIEFIIEENN